MKARFARPAGYIGFHVAQRLTARGDAVVGFDVIAAQREFHADIDVWDPWVDREEARSEFGIELLEAMPGPRTYDADVLSAGHREFAALGAEQVRGLCRKGAVFFDVEGVFARGESDGRL